MSHSEVSDVFGEKIHEKTTEIKTRSLKMKQRLQSSLIK